MAFLSEDLFEKFRTLVYEASGISFTETNRAVLESRVKDRLRTRGISTPEEYYREVSSSEEELREFLDVVTTNLTRFFRNQGHWETFRHAVIPDLVERKRAQGVRSLLVWSAGCSTGEEPYTIAMVLSEHLPPGFSFLVVGSDISLSSLLVAKEGFYTDARVEGVPEHYLAKYFEKKENGYRVRDELRTRVQFDYHNLKHQSDLRDVDVVFCRNVLIYFDEAAQKATIQGLWNVMAPYSYLFIGHSESLFGMNTGFEFVKTEWGTVYRKNVTQ
ncbi:MCP methyltransferase, CheR-type [Spirochaeta thermophila DSM 6578]|uniref:protein-glutamate O-methyltransferase n=1 Tax=Winmispira thermophila (strain ATCC 700085 / DSM 6578 / Z-1203) TaxID=869211 RepID=G0GG14_WINT7|nr:protein-glutamate O-methyltransferase CheR [Spirochaeta thermophila]AEJ62490.1 MCP methyltransferase, CheR-type [Spirochaeta thermophila DSM 6578]